MGGGGVTGLWVSSDSAEAGNVVGDPVRAWASEETQPLAGMLLEAVEGR